MLKKELKGVSLFSSAGIAEQYLYDLNIHIVAANEIVKERAELYQAVYPDSKMICGDILDYNIFETIIKESPEKIDFLLASPPCQGMSIAGRNRSLKQMREDKRNYLIFKVIEFIKRKNPNYVLIENVPAFLKIELLYKDRLMKVLDILKETFSTQYHIDANIYDVADYGIPQHRNRAIIKMYLKGLVWEEPLKSPKVTVNEAIGFLPSIEAGERSNVKWHFARKHSKAQIDCMAHTPTGKSAIDNPVHYPKKNNGDRIKAYKTTYRRIKWDEPAPTITMRNDAISSQMNVHPGRMNDDGTYSDARVLTPLELMLLSSIPVDWNIPDDTSELLIRRCIGEGIPPLFLKKIIEPIKR